MSKREYPAANNFEPGDPVKIGDDGRAYRILAHEPELIQSKIRALKRKLDKREPATDADFED